MLKETGPGFTRGLGRPIGRAVVDDDDLMDDPVCLKHVPNRRNG
jgi:hypothetical protein